MYCIAIIIIIIIITFLSLVSTNNATAGHTHIRSQHISSLSQQLQPCASKWDAVSMQLGFKHHEIENIRATPILLLSAPMSYLNAILSNWSHWVPGDSRHSQDYATLENLKHAVSKAGYPKLASELNIN